MYIVTQQSELDRGIRKVRHFVSNTTSMPVLQGILFETRKNRIKLTATDMEMGIQFCIPADVKREGRVVLPEAYLGGLAKELPSEPIEIEQDPEKPDKVEIRCENSIFKMGNLDADQFPDFPEVEGNTYTFPQKLFSRIIKQTVYAISSDETRPYLTGALTEFKGDRLVMVATDTRRLTYSEEVCKSEEDDADHVKSEGEEKVVKISDQKYSKETESDSIIIPGKTLNEISRLIDSESESLLEITVSPKQLLFEFEKVTVFSRIIDGQFPNYIQFFPENMVAKAIVDRDLLIRISRRSQMIARKNQMMIIDFNEDMTKIRTQSEDGDQAYEELPCDYQGESITIGFNVGYMLDFLQAISTGELSIELKGDEDPAIFKPHEENGYSYILMPIRLN